jgi:O-antigen chain-terminating methyltransferase
MNKSNENLAATLESLPTESRNMDDREKRPDVVSIMAEIRARVRDDVARMKDQSKPLPTYAANFESSPRKAGELMYSEELRFLNNNYSYARLNLDSITTHRKNFLGRFIVKAKRKVLSIVWDNLLKDYFAAEREYQANLVRYLNDVSKYVDARDASNFWELIRKIDYDITKAMERIEKISDEQGATSHAMERRFSDGLTAAVNDINKNLGRLNTLAEQHENKLQVLDSVSRGLEGLVARISAPTTAHYMPAEQGAAGAELPDFSYVLLENRYRGSVSEISQRLAIYPPYFKGASQPVLEIGGGRGELQLLFREAGIPSYCVDLDAAMVEESRKRGVDARHGDGIAHLRSLPDRSIAGVIAVQVVEHLTRAQLQELFTLCQAKVVSGGSIIFETINPQSVLALSSNYFRDPTHIWPLHPDTLGFAMGLAGLQVKEVRKLSPVPREAQLKEIAREDYMTPRWLETIEVLNRNIRQLNDLLYGFQDFCIVAKVP